MRRTAGLRAGLLAVAALVAVVAAGVAASAPASADDAGRDPWLGDRRVFNIAHQGGEDEAPSNTMFAFKRAVAAGADMLELDVGVTADGAVVVMHDTTVDRVTDGTGVVSTMTLAQVKALDAGYRFCAGGGYRRDCPGGTPYRGIATGAVPPPAGSTAADFRITTLPEVLAAFPDTPVSVEVKGRTPAEDDAEYVANAEVVAGVLAGVGRDDIVVVSFRQSAVDRFHQLAPTVATAPGETAAIRWLLGGQSPGEGVRAFLLPTRQAGLPVTTEATVARAHAEGLAWYVWLVDGADESPAGYRRLLELCVDGVMTGRPAAFEPVLEQWRADGGEQRCATATAVATDGSSAVSTTAHGSSSSPPWWLLVVTAVAGAGAGLVIGRVWVLRSEHEG